MFETVSVDEAIQKGTRMVVYPRWTLFFICIAAGYFGVNNVAPGTYVFAGVIVGLIGGWLYWSIASTRWKVWAYDNVRNIHELQKRAVKEGIIAQDGSFWDSTTIKTGDSRQKLEALQTKFDVPDVFLDDVEIPAETQIFYSKNKNMLGLAVMGAFLIGGICLIVFSNNYAGLLLVAVALFAGADDLRKLTNHEPQITINAEGIATSSTQFYNWKDIEGEDVIVVRHGKSSTHNLVYDCRGISESLDIGPLGVTQHELENLLRVYRGRSEQQLKHY